MTEDLDSLTWLKACGTSACLEIAHHNGYVYLRATSRPFTIVELTEQEWLDTKEAIHRGAIA